MQKYKSSQIDTSAQMHYTIFVYTICLVWIQSFINTSNQFNSSENDVTFLYGGTVEKQENRFQDEFVNRHLLRHREPSLKAHALMPKCRK